MQFLQHFQGLWAVPGSLRISNLVIFSQGVTKLWGVTSECVFLRIVRSDKVSKVQKWHGSPLSGRQAQHSGDRTLHATEAAKSSMFITCFFVHHTSEQ